MSKYDPYRWLTGEGMIALRRRLLSYVDLFNDYEFPFHAKMLGFPEVHLDNKEECFSKIKELVEITASKIRVMNCTTKNGDGSEKLNQTIKLFEMEVLENDGR